MSIRTTVTLDDDVIERLKTESRAQGKSFRDTLNDLLRIALIAREQKPAKSKFVVKPSAMGFRPGLNHDSVEALLEYGEGETHR